MPPMSRRKNELCSEPCEVWRGTVPVLLSAAPSSLSGGGGMTGIAAVDISFSMCSELHRKRAD
jgi:hypothetical protein